MTRTDDSKIIEIVNPICCGLDVHKKKISACILFPESSVSNHCEVKEFGTFTDDLQRLKSWLLKHECPIVAMESTGIYWRPVHNVLENVVHVILVIKINIFI